MTVTKYDWQKAAVNVLAQVGMAALVLVLVGVRTRITGDGPFASLGEFWGWARAWWQVGLAVPVIALLLDLLRYTGQEAA